MTNASRMQPQSTIKPPDGSSCLGGLIVVRGSSNSKLGKLVGTPLNKHLQVDTDRYCSGD